VIYAVNLSSWVFGGQEIQFFKEVVMDVRLEVRHAEGMEGRLCNVGCILAEYVYIYCYEVFVVREQRSGWVGSCEGGLIYPLTKTTQAINEGTVYERFVVIVTPL